MQPSKRDPRETPKAGDVVYPVMKPGFGPSDNEYHVCAVVDNVMAVSNRHGTEITWMLIVNWCSDASYIDHWEVLHATD